MTINTTIPLVDTNILISFFIEDQFYEKSAQVLKNKAFINNLILTELLNFLQNKYSCYKSFKITRYILNNQQQIFILPTEQTLYYNAYQIMEKYLDNQLSYVDCLILAQAEALGLTVYTSDVRMQNYKPVQVVNPFL